MEKQTLKIPAKEYFANYLYPQVKDVEKFSASVIRSVARERIIYIVSNWWNALLKNDEYRDRLAEMYYMMEKNVCYHLTFWLSNSLIKNKVPGFQAVRLNVPDDAMHGYCAIFCGKVFNKENAIIPENWFLVNFAAEINKSLEEMGIDSVEKSKEAFADPTKIKSLLKLDFVGQGEFSDIKIMIPTEYRFEEKDDEIVFGFGKVMFEMEITVKHHTKNQDENVCAGNLSINTERTLAADVKIDNYFV